MGVLKILALSATLVAAALGSAMAADMAGMPEIPTVDSGVEPELGSNWYLRGDVGFAASNIKFDVNLGTSDSVDDNQSTWSTGGGVGYNFGWFRTDLTLDYLAQRDVDFNSLNSNCSDGTATAGTDRCINRNHSNFDVVPLLLNGYIDLGTWSGVSPYVGAGAGAALVSFQNWRTQTVGCSPPGGSCPALPVPAVSNHSIDDWRFAWALMAGFSYHLNQNLALDVGYRFIDVPDGKAVGNVRPSTTPPNSIGSVDYSDLMSHEVRVGFRYTID
jgi:opacity protein-like surface antigen